MVLSNRRMLDRLLGELDVIIDDASGGMKAKAKKEKLSGFEDVKKEIFELLTDTRLVVDTLNHRKGEQQTSDDFKLERQVDQNLAQMRSLLEKCEEQIIAEAPKKMKKKFKEQHFVWKVAYVCNGDEEGSPGWPLWFQIMSEADRFKEEVTQGTNFADMEDFERVFGVEDPDGSMAELKKFFTFCDRDGDGKVGTEDFYVTRKEVCLSVNKCRAVLLLKKQIDFIDYRHKPHRFRRNAKSSKGYGASSLGGVGSSGKKMGKAAQALAARNAEAAKMGDSYRPSAPTQQEQEFLQKSALWEEQLNVELEEIIQGLKRLQVVAEDVAVELEEQAEIMEELDDRMIKVDEIIGVEIDRLQELLDKSGGMSTWCPRIIAIVIILALLGYLVKSGNL